MISNDTQQVLELHVDHDNTTAVHLLGYSSPTEALVCPQFFTSMLYLFPFLSWMNSLTCVYDIPTIGSQSKFQLLILFSVIQYIVFIN